MSSNKKCFHLSDKDSVARKREVRSVKWIKVLLIVVGVSLVFALGVICALSLLYAGKFGLSVKVKDCLYSCTEFSGSSCKLCEEGWTPHGGKCYFFSSVNKTWFEARDLCAGLKAHLVTINSKAVHGFLVSKIKETHWIGLNDQKTEGRWVWLNDQTLEETGVKFWFSNQPDNWTGDNPSGEDCVCLGFNREFLKSWFDASCKYKKKFICEKKFIAL
ncbi:CD209 antigen-like protein C [Paramisgurnus dabryanus]|uniref:CD209 antigen-like protein C n=1 Tax=Paramisgurnus dabryanus TaxID=90735 RepID=UPI0031F475FC